LESFAESSAQWPLLNIPGALLRDWMPLIDEYHYCEYGHRHPFSALIFVYRYVHVVGFTSLYTSSVNPSREFCRCPVPIYVSTVRLFMAIYSIHTVLVPMLRPVPLLCTYSPSPLCLENRFQPRKSSQSLQSTLMKSSLYVASP
jgi:hypothetical protein